MESAGSTGDSDSDDDGNDDDDDESGGGDTDKAARDEDEEAEEKYSPWSPVRKLAPGRRPWSMKRAAPWAWRMMTAPSLLHRGAKDGSKAGR